MIAAGVLLPTDHVTLLPPDGVDEHGWRLPGTEPAWHGPGNLQLMPGMTQNRAEASGGRGPFGPARALVGTVYLPPEANPDDGYAAEIRGRTFVLSQTRLIPDPAGGGLTCWAATATSTDTWPGGDDPGPGGDGDGKR